MPSGLPLVHVGAAALMFEGRGDGEPRSRLALVAAVALVVLGEPLVMAIVRSSRRSPLASVRANAAVEGGAGEGLLTRLREGAHDLLDKCHRRNFWDVRDADRVNPV